MHLFSEWAAHYGKKLALLPGREQIPARDIRTVQAIRSRSRERDGVWWGHKLGKTSTSHKEAVRTQKASA